MLHKKNPLDAEWEKLIKSEAKFLNDRYVKKDSFLNKKLSETHLPDTRHRSRATPARSSA